MITTGDYSEKDVVWLNLTAFARESIGTHLVLHGLTLEIDCEGSESQGLGSRLGYNALGIFRALSSSVPIGNVCTNSFHK